MEARESLRSYVSKLFDLGKVTASNAADSVLALETALAKVQWERTDLRDAEKRYNKFTRDELKKLAPSTNIGTYLKTAGVMDEGDVIVTSPSLDDG